MTKEKFISAIRELEEGEKLQDKIANAVRQYNNIMHTDWPEPFGMVIAHDFLAVDLLEELMGDDSETISYFCYDLEFGRKYYPGCITEEDGTEIDLSNAEKLWEYLIKGDN